MSKRTTTIILVSFFIVFAAVFMTYYYTQTRDLPKKLPILGNPGHRVSDFSFTNQDGKTVTLANVDGKIRVVNYFFTTCKGICPRMNENMTKVYQAYRGNNDILILSHTVDPKKDTVGAMKAYSMHFDADPNQWMFLTGDKKALYEMARDEYLVTAVDDTATADINSDFIHSERFILVDKGGRIRGQYDGLNAGEVNQLIGDIKELLKEE
ncbi:MAG TPA: SCO family protein [Flavipsychrobacter sp.]|jgi:protein SCO1|nr:SCO family protein [Chitinophagales bacterium]HLO71033.1 SCO family protein [Flavipsychrobacter sp.]